MLSFNSVTVPAVVTGCYLQASEIVFICAALAKRFGVHVAGQHKIGSIHNRGIVLVYIIEYNL